MHNCGYVPGAPFQFFSVLWNQGKIELVQKPTMEIVFLPIFYRAMWNVKCTLYIA